VFQERTGNVRYQKLTVAPGEVDAAIKELTGRQV